MVYGKSTFDIILNYIKNSWNIQHTKIKFITRNNPIFQDYEPICNICVNDLYQKPDDLEGYNVKDKIVILPCKHIFHYKCWLHKIKSNLLLNIKSIRCPHYSCNYQLDIAEEIEGILRKFLDYDIKNRISAKDALELDWFTKLS